jgi:homocysteine S-methyltransferase
VTPIPLLSDEIYLTDSGIETDLIFNHGIDLPAFAAFPLLDSANGRGVLTDYYRAHLAVAQRHRLGFVLEAPTWRANTDWGRVVGYDQTALTRINTDAIEMMRNLSRDAVGPVVVSGCIGARSDGYCPTDQMGADAAGVYHRPQLDAFRAAGADLANAMTIAYPDEAIGIVLAAADIGLPVAISFTVETDGRLPNGTALADAVRQVDTATGGSAAYFAVNCAHPDHIELAIEAGADWTSRLRAVRANASRRSHAELDEASDLDAGDPAEFAAGYRRLRASVPTLTVLGGCCGTDVRHVAAVADGRD